MKNVVKERAYWLEVMSRFGSGDLTAFGEIYAGFIDSLLSYGLKMTRDHELVKDCIQDVFLHLHRLNPTLQHPEYIEFYLFRSLKNAINTKFLQNKKSEAFPSGELVAFELRYNVELETDDPESDQLRIDKLKEILKSLDPQKRELLYLKFSTGLNYVEIGNLLQMNPETVKKQVYRTLDHLRGKYGNELMELLVLFVKN